MSVRERPKDEKEKSKSQPSAKKEEASTVEDWLDGYSTKVVEQPDVKAESKPVQQVDKIVETKVDPTEQLLKKFFQQLPQWIEKPWMYVKPTHEGHLESWIDSWKEVILSFSKTLAKHIINIYDLQKIHPFTNRLNKRKLKVDHIEYLIQEMVDQNMAKWIDEGIMARIYYKSDIEWANNVYEYLMETGMAAEVLTLYELQQLKEEWSSLPEQELRLVLDVLVLNEQARWVDTDKESIKIDI